MLEIFEDDIRLTGSFHSKKGNSKKESVICKKGSAEYCVKMTDGMPSQIGGGFRTLDTKLMLPL